MLLCIAFVHNATAAHKNDTRVRFSSLRSQTICDLRKGRPLGGWGGVNLRIHFTMTTINHSHFRLKIKRHYSESYLLLCTSDFPPLRDDETYQNCIVSFCLIIKNTVSGFHANWIRFQRAKLCQVKKEIPVDPQGYNQVNIQLTYVAWRKYSYQNTSYSVNIFIIEKKNRSFSFAAKAKFSRYTILVFYFFCIHLNFF